MENPQLYIIQAGNLSYNDDKKYYDNHETIAYYKVKLSQIKEEDAQLRNKITMLNRVFYQISSLSSRAIEIKYVSNAPEIVNIPQKTVLPPLPSIGNKSDISSVVLTSDPLEVSKFINRNAIIPSLFFQGKFFFDKQFLFSLFHSSPDIQISLLVSIFDEIKRNQTFMNELLPLLSSFSTHNSIKSQMGDPEANISNFFAFYLHILSQIAHITNSKYAKIIYHSKESNSLVYPTKSHIYMIDPNDSLCGYLMKKDSIFLLKDPKKHPSYETINEAAVFDQNSGLMSFSFKSGKISVDYLLILFNDRSPTLLDEAVLSIVSNYLSPMINVFYTIFMFVAPRHFSSLCESVSSLRTFHSVFDLIKKESCKLAEASQCKIFSVDKPRTDTSDVIPLPKEPSLILKAFESNSVFSCRNPRTYPGFNHKVDDDPNLPRISSMLIVPVVSVSLVLVLYNSVNSGEFRNIHGSLVGLFSKSFPPIIEQYTMRTQMNKVKELQYEKEMDLLRAIKCFRPLVRSVESEHFWETIRKFLPCGVEINMFMFLNKDEALRFPDKTLHKNLNGALAKADLTSVFKDGFDCEIEGGGIPSTQSVLIVPSYTDRKYSCVFSCDKQDYFDTSDQSYFVQLARFIHFVFPIYLNYYWLSQIKKCLIQFKRLSGFSITALSDVVGITVKNQEFDPPLEDYHENSQKGGLTVLVETDKGIESVLSTIYPIRNQESKEVLLAYAQYYSSYLNHLSTTNQSTNKIITFFTATPLLDIFNCSIIVLSEWITRINNIYEQGKFNTRSIYHKLKFAQELINIKTWSDWFTNEERTVIFVLSYLGGIQTISRFISDDSLLALAKGKRAASCQFLTAIFGKGIGLSDSMSESDKYLLADSIDCYVVGHTSFDETRLVTCVRQASLASFKFSELTKVSIGQAIVFLSCIEIFTREYEEAKAEFVFSYPEETRRKLLFRLERIYLPVLAYFTQRNEKIIQMVTNVRNFLKNIKEQK